MSDSNLPLKETSNIFEDHEEHEVVLSPKTQRNRWWLIAGIAALCLVLGGNRLLARFEGKVPLFSQPTQNTQPTPSPTPTPEPGLTVLLMGRGGAGHDGGALADTILLARFLEEQKKVVLISIPRDLWVSIPYKGNDGVSGKINGAYAIGIDQKNYSDKAEKYTGAYGGGALAKDVVTQVTGLSIDKYITVDFSGFEQAIDKLGGITVPVDRAFTDYEYPISGRESLDCSTYVPAATGSALLSEADLIATGELDPTVLPELPKAHPCRYERLQFSLGSQTMDGKTALKYVRSRHSSEDGSDFSRSRRQRILLQAVTEKLFSVNAITKIPTFFSTLRAHVHTNLSNTDIVCLLPKASTYRGYEIVNLTLTTDNYLTQGYSQDRQFQLYPSPGIGQYDAIKNWIGRAINPTTQNLYPIIELTSPNQNASSAATLKDAFLQAGYPTRLMKSSVKEATTSATLIIQTDTIAPETIAKIKVLSNISDEFVQTKIASSTSQVQTDIKLLLP